jgi:hypothetical protein
VKTIAEALDAGGWIRKQPTGMTFGVPTIRINFGKGSEFVPACIESGIGLHIRTRQSLAVLQSTLFQNLPRDIQAALTLKNSMASIISPEDTRSVAAGIIDPGPADKGPITICVGKKP